MKDKGVITTVKFVICGVVGLLSALATRKILIGIGIMLAIFVAWSMWEYIKDITNTPQTDHHNEDINKDD